MSLKSIRRLTRQFESGDHSPVHALRNMLDRMSQPETKSLNAFNYTVAEEDALTLAEQSEQRYKNGKQLSSIDGVPITFKDNYLVKDMPSTAGSKILKDFIPPIDSTLARR